MSNSFLYVGFVHARQALRHRAVSPPHISHQCCPLVTVVTFKFSVWLVAAIVDSADEQSPDGWEGQGLLRARGGGGGVHGNGITPAHRAPYCLG